MGEIRMADMLMIIGSGENLTHSENDPNNPGGGWGKEREEEFEGETAEVTWGNLW